MRGRFVAILVRLAVTALLAAGFLETVDLRPEVSGTFFFSAQDPQFREEQRISAYFPGVGEQIILSVIGEVDSPQYIRVIRELTRALQRMPSTGSVLSLSRGPAGLRQAYESPLWSRLLIAGEDATLLLVMVDPQADLSAAVSDIEAIARRFEREDVRILLSGAPYIVEQIQRNLVRDLRVFSGTAFILFGIMALILFRSVWIVAGMLTACTSATMLTLLVNERLDIRVGLLTANVATIVFVLTLSHTVFILFNWRRTLAGEADRDAVNRAVRLTLPASWWSMVTTFLGFFSLLFVAAEPLRHLGVAGSVGTLCAFITAYLMFPPFVSAARRPRTLSAGSECFSRPLDELFNNRGTLLAGVLVLIAACLPGVLRVNTDPPMLAYFQPGGAVYDGLALLDRYGGSSVLKIVVSDSDERNLLSGPRFGRLRRLQERLEAHPAVGSAISVSLILEEGRRRIPLSFLFPREWIVDILEWPLFGSVADQFITSDRKRALMLLRMREEVQRSSRRQVVAELRRIVRAGGLVPEYVGGLYALQGKLARLVAVSLFGGLVILIVSFAVMGLVLSRSLRIMTGMLAGLCCIPLWTLGIAGYGGIPMDVVAAPSINIAVGMGVDAMIHLLMFVRREYGRSMAARQGWAQAIRCLWKPVVSSTVIVIAGFGIFSLSQFPPTRRFGWFVILSMLMSPLAALLILPSAACCPKVEGNEHKEESPHSR